MQQQQTSTTSNLQIKLITDARKLLEKVRTQQVLSADSSFDSSFLFDSYPKAVATKKGSGSSDEKIALNDDTKQSEIIAGCSSSISSSIFLKEEFAQHVNGGEGLHPSIIEPTNGSDAFEMKYNGEDDYGSSKETIADENGSSKVTSKEIIADENGSNKVPYKEAISNDNGSNKEAIADDNGSNKMTNKETISDDDGSSKMTHKENIAYDNGSSKMTNKETIADDDGSSKVTNKEIIADDDGSSKVTNKEIIADDISIEMLQLENMKLRTDNYHLNEEMNDFEYKLYCLEHTLGVLKDVETSSQNGKNEQRNIETNESINTTPKSLPLGVTVLNQENNRLSPITAMVAEAFIAGSGGNDALLNNNAVIASSGRDAPPPTPITNAQEEELKLLRENNEKMVTAIKALAQSTIAQTRKHYLYKKRHTMTKQMVVEESEKSNQLMTEKEKITEEFHATRANFLKERDIREELSSEVQLLAKKNNGMKKDRKRDDEVRQRILERVESRDDTSSVLSRLSQSSCFPILQTITENRPANIPSTERPPIIRDKNLEKLILKLISQLKKRDGKIEKLEKKLKITMQYLQGALELEVARQDAALEGLKTITVDDIKNIANKENTMVEV
jgi:hypothetical protein